MGHIARLVEAGGIPTVVIGVKAFRDRLAAMRLPRTVITPHPMGRTLGAPGKREIQKKIIMVALDMLENATNPDIIVDLAGNYRA